jgi:hypothetical protein
MRGPALRLPCVAMTEMVRMAEDDLISQWEALSGEAPARPFRRDAVVEATTAARPVSDADRNAWLQALHRGFGDAHRESYGTQFTSWETPLPQLTWAHQSIEKVKSWLEAGGFPWEVEAAAGNRSRPREHRSATAE